MADVRFFATVAGQAVQLKNVGYSPGGPDRDGVLPILSDTGKRVGDGASIQWREYAVGKYKGVRYFADRKIIRSANPSNHKCDSRCTNAKGHNCECSCGGKNHGKGD